MAVDAARAKSLFLEASDLDDPARLVIKTNIEGIATVAWNGDGTRLATGNGDGTAIIWDTRTGARVVTLGVESPTIHSIAWNKDGSRIALGREDESAALKVRAELWDPRNGKKVLDLGTKGWVHSVAFSPDGARVAIATDRKTAQIFDVKTGPNSSFSRGTLARSVPWPSAPTARRF
jgi:WD40 repeat protein